MKLYFREMGEGPAVVILHGLLGSGDNWQRIAKELAKSYRVLLVDQRNHGRSPHGQQFDYPTMARDLNNLLSDLQIRSISLIGHSMGGKTAMTFAARYPHRLNKLQVVDITPRASESPEFEIIFQAMMNLDLSSLYSRTQADERIKDKIRDPIVRGFILKNLGRNSESRIVWKPNVPVIYQQLGAISGALKLNEHVFEGPTLFVGGGKSDYIREEDHALIRHHFPAANIEMIPGAGHWVHFEAPEAFLETTKNFLRRSW